MSNTHPPPPPPKTFLSLVFFLKRSWKSIFFLFKRLNKNTQKSLFNQSLSYLSWIIVFVIDPLNPPPPEIPTLSSYWLLKRKKMAALQSPHSISRFHEIIPHPYMYTKNKDFNPLIFNFSNFGDQKIRKKLKWKAHGEKKK